MLLSFFLLSFFFYLCSKLHVLTKIFIMKKLFFLLVAAGALLTAACDDFDCCLPNVIEITDDFKFAADGSLVMDPIALPPGMTYIVIDGSWLDASCLGTGAPLAEYHLDYTTNRYGFVTVKASNGDEITVDAVQYAPVGLAVTPDDDKDYDVFGYTLTPGLVRLNTYYVEVFSDFPWVAEVTYELTSPTGWIALSHYSTTNGGLSNLQFNVAENDDLKARKGYVTITEPVTGKFIIITIEQDGQLDFADQALEKLKSEIEALAAIAYVDYIDNGGVASNRLAPGIYTSTTYPNAIAILLWEPGTTFELNGVTLTVGDWSTAYPISIKPDPAGAWAPITPGFNYWGVFNFNPATYPAVSDFPYYYGLYCYNSTSATNMVIYVNLSYTTNGGTPISTGDQPITFTWP